MPHACTLRTRAKYLRRIQVPCVGQRPHELRRMVQGCLLPGADVRCDHMLQLELQTQSHRPSEDAEASHLMPDILSSKQILLSSQGGLNHASTV